MIGARWPEPGIFERLGWWWISNVWWPLKGRCSWCGLFLVPEDDERVGDGHYDTHGIKLGWGRVACQGCIEYGD